MTFIEGAVFIGKGGLAVGRSFKAAGAELYCCWVDCGGLYKLGCCGSLALVKEEGEASGACVGGACADRVCVDGACVDGACVGGACVDKVACWGIDVIGG